MFKKIKEFFVGKPVAKVTEAVSAPYKVPEPPAVTPIPLVAEIAAPAVVEAAPAVVEAAPVVVEAAPVVVEAAPAKKPRKPRTPKAPVEVVKEKAPAKAKAVPKLTVVKSTKNSTKTKSKKV